MTHFVKEKRVTGKRKIPKKINRGRQEEIKGEHPQETNEEVHSMPLVVCVEIGKERRSLKVSLLRPLIE